MSDDVWDSIVVGGGPAGLTAATYLARSRRRFRLIDAGESRTTWIPRSRNVPGFPEGVEGPALLARMRAESERFGTEITSGRVDTLAHDADAGFTLGLEGGDVLRARTVILTTGVKDRVPEHLGAFDAVKRGVLRLCPICDGYETQGKHVGVLGCSDHAAAEALFLRTYSDRVTLVLTDPEGSLDDSRRRELSEAAIRVVAASLDDVRYEQSRVLCPSDQGELRFDTAYCAYGIDPHTQLARQLGVVLSDDGCVTVDSHQQTSVEGVYAAGDTVLGLNQIAVACAEGAVAAIAVHNRLPRNFA